MGENSAIAWTDHTHNEWIGCQRVSPGCGGAVGVGGCYAQVSAPVRIQRSKGVELWGPPATAQRMRTSEENRKKPFVWNRKAEKLGVRYRVFCSSLSDVFEDHPDVHEWRRELFALIKATPCLDWQLLTKRPENLRRFLPQAWLDKPRPNVWLGTTVEDQKRANERILPLIETPAAVRFLSCEPLLEAVNFRRAEVAISDAIDSEWRDGRRGTPLVSILGDEDSRGDIHWVIAGGESGPGARPFDLAWARSLRDQCASAGVAYFCKQLGSNAIDSDGFDVLNERGGVAYSRGSDEPDVETMRLEALARGRVLQSRNCSRFLRDRSGADPAEWPADLRVQQFPEVRS